MNEDTTPVVDTSVSESAEEGSTTPEEVAQVLHLQGEPQAEANEANSDSPEEELASEEAVEDEPTVEEEATEETPAIQPTTEETTEAETPDFTIEIEDANGVKFTLSPDDKLDEVLAEFEPKNNGQVLQLMRDLDSLSQQKQSWEKEQQEQSVAAEREQTIANIQQGWDSEIDRLTGEKRLQPTVGDKPNERVQAVFKFMGEVNAKRAETGQPPIQSFEDALDKLELKEYREAEKAKAKEAREENKKRGALVGGSSAATTSGAPVYVQGSARNATEAARSMGLLN